MAHLYVLIAGALARHRERGNHLLLLEEQAALGGWKRMKEGFSVTDDTVKSWVVVVDFRNVNYFLVKAKWQRREVTGVVSPGRGCAAQTTPGTTLARGRGAFGLPPFFPYPLQLCQRSSSLPCSKPASPVTRPVVPSSAAAPLSHPRGWQALLVQSGPPGPWARLCPPVRLSETHRVLLKCSQQTMSKTNFLAVLPCPGTHIASVMVVKAVKDQWFLLWSQMFYLAKGPESNKQILCYLTV